MARPAAVHPPEPRLRQHRRRHLRPFRRARRASGGRRRRADHLQDPLQRLRLDDGRAADRGRHDADPDPGRTRRRRRQEDGARGRRPGPLSRRSAAARRDPAPPRRDGRGSARVPRVQGRFGHPLRPALRDRAPAPAQARQMGRSGDPHLHPSRSVRRLRRLRARLQLHGDRAARDRMGPQAAHQPVELQQGFHLRRGLLPELRHRPWRAAAQGPTPPTPRDSAAGSRAGPAGDGRALERARRGHRRLGRRHRQPDAGRRGLSGRAVQLQSRPHRLEPEIRRRHLACAAGAQAGGAARDADRLGRGGRADRLRPHRRGGRRMPVEAQAGLARRRRRGPHPDVRVRAQSGLERRQGGVDRADRRRALARRRSSSTGSGSPRALLGDAIASNMFMLGAAWQRGLVPVRREAIERAIELNGVAIEANRQAFEWGRRAAHDLAGVEKLVGERRARARGRAVARRADREARRRISASRAAKRRRSAIARSWTRCGRRKRRRVSAKR